MDNLWIDLEEIMRQEGCLSWRQKKKKKSINWWWEHIRNDRIAFILGNPELSLAVRDVRVLELAGVPVFPVLVVMFKE